MACFRMPKLTLACLLCAAWSCGSTGVVDLTEMSAQGPGLQLVKPAPFFDACLNIPKVMAFIDDFPRDAQTLMVLDVCSGKERRFCREARKEGFAAAWFEILLDPEYLLFGLLAFLSAGACVYD